MTSACCCPPNSIPYFRDDYTPQGTKSAVGDLEFYTVGTPVEGGRAIVIIPDIWGWDSGRTRRFADLLAEKFQFVVVPKLFIPNFEGGTDGDALPPDFDLNVRGGECWPWLAQFTYEFLKPKTDALLAHVREQGVVKIGLLGFCWGGWLSTKIACDHADIACVVSPHPSITVEEGLHKGVIADLVSKVRCPVLTMPAGNDPPTYLPGGLIHDTFATNNQNSQSVHFPDMIHGFCSRGDMQDEKVLRDVTQATQLMVDFYTVNLA